MSWAWHKKPCRILGSSSEHLHGRIPKGVWVAARSSLARGFVHLFANLFFMNDPVINNEAQVEEGLFKRHVIFIVDLISITVLFWPVDKLFFNGEFYSDNYTDSSMFSFFIFYLLYFVFTEYKFGQTIGYRLFKVKIVDSQTYKKPGLWQLIKRELLSLLGLTGIGYLVLLFSGFYWDRHTGVTVIKSESPLVDP